MAYTITDDRVGCQGIAVTDTTRNHPLGSILRASDPTYGEGEFIYLKGVGSTVVGSMVVWDGASAGVPTYQTVLCPSTAMLGQSVAFAMSANVASQFGWYQIGGSAVAATNGTLAAGPAAIYIGTAGTVTSTGAAGKQVVNARNSTATGTPATNQAVILIDRPFAQGVIT